MVAKTHQEYVPMNHRIKAFRSDVFVEEIKSKSNKLSHFS